jgi:CBS domain-containing protein
MTTVSEVMTKEVFAVAPDTSLESAARMMASKSITGAPVVSEDGETVGVVTLIDLADPDNQASDNPGYSTFYQIADGWAQTIGNAKSPAAGRVADVMTRAALTTSEETSIEDAAALMLEAKVHRLLVERDGQLTGIVSTMDIIRGFLGG